MIATIQSIIWDFKIFTQIYVMTNGGGIAGRNLVLNVYAYQKAFAGEEYGLGSAIGVVMTMLLMLITVALPQDAAEVRMATLALRKRRRPGRLIAEIVCVVVAVLVAVPLYWMVLSAFKPAGELQSAAPWTFAPSFDSFERVLGWQGFGRYFLNSTIVALCVVALSMLLSFLSAVALTRFRFKGRTVLLVMLLVAQMVPVEALTIPLFFMVQLGSVRRFRRSG